MWGPRANRARHGPGRALVYTGLRVSILTRKQCVELSAPLPPTTNRSWDVARHVLSRRHGSREGGCQVSENLGDMAEGIGAESIDGLLCNLAPARLQLRQKCPAPGAELDDRGATVSW